jgi:hypothetical protein
MLRLKAPGRSAPLPQGGRPGPLRPSCGTASSLRFGPRPWGSAQAYSTPDFFHQRAGPTIPRDRRNGRAPPDESGKATQTKNRRVRTGDRPSGGVVTFASSSIHGDVTVATKISSEISLTNGPQSVGRSLSRVRGLVSLLADGPAPSAWLGAPSRVGNSAERPSDAGRPRSTR